MKKIALLFFGGHIKKEAWKCSNASLSIAKSRYEWIIDAPVKQWRKRLWCIRHCKCRDSCEELYDWLTR